MTGMSDTFWHLWPR